MDGMELDFLSASHLWLPVQISEDSYAYTCTYTEYPQFPMWAGVTSYKVDLDSKMVVVVGDIIPFEVLESVSKVKKAELWPSAEAEEQSHIIEI